MDFGHYKRIIRYFWDPEPKNDDDSDFSIWCLGERYDSGADFTLDESFPSPQNVQENSSVCSADAISQRPKSVEIAATSSVHTAPFHAEATGVDRGSAWPKGFLDDFESRLLFTYRSYFPAINRSSDPKVPYSVAPTVQLRHHLVGQGGFTSDTGWGCMIRSGQSLLANALANLKLGRDWRRGEEQDEERRLLRLFADHPDAPFSIHKFVEHGASACGKRPGEWFGPSATARCIQALSAMYATIGLKVYIAGDGADVYEDSFFSVATGVDGQFIPTLVLVAIRLGIDQVTPAYWEALKASLRYSQSVGIAGGRPSSSHYFVAIQGNKFFYLDPHQTRPALPLRLDASNYTVEEIDSCHTRRLRRLPIEEMDPSMLIGFLIKDKEDWRKWRKNIGAVVGKPVVHIADAEPVSPDNKEQLGTIYEVEALEEYESDVEFL